MKIGEKIVATTDVYVPIGSIMTVTKVYNDLDIGATLDGGDRFNWYMKDGTYEPYTPKSKTTGTLKELNAKPGDVVEWDGEEYVAFEQPAPREAVWAGNVNDGWIGISANDCTLISRAANTPASLENLSTIATPFGLLDKDTQDAMQDAWESGLDVECFGGNGWRVIKSPSWATIDTYRIASKPTMLTLTREFSHLGKHVITCRPDGSEPTVEWVAAE